MKTKHLLPLFFLTSLVLSCNLTLPESVKFKTKANYNFTVAKLNLELADYFDPATLIPTDESSPFKIYDYNPPSNTKGIQQYVINMPIQEIPLDMSAYLGSTDLGSSLEAMSFNKEIEIPSLDMAGEEVLDVDDIGIIVNTSFQIESDGGAEYVEVTTEGSTFSTVNYKTGSLIVVFSSNVNGTVSLVTASKSLIAKSNVMTNTNQCVIPLDGKAIPHDAQLFIQTDDLSASFKAGVDPSSECEKVVGLTITDYSAFEPIVFNQTIDASGLDSFVESVTFGDDCSFELIEKYPSGWSGISIESAITMTGGITATLSNTNTSLKDKVFTPGNINVGISVLPRINNATIIFNQQPTLGYSLKAKKLMSVVLKADGIATDFNVNQELPAGASDMIKQVDWKAGTGIKITYSNTLPAGNDFTLKNVESNFIGLSAPETKLLAGSNKQVVKIATTTDTSSPITSTTKIDFAGKLELPGDGSKFNISNIETGKKYLIDICIEPILDWKSITIDSSIAAVSTQFGIEFNKADIFKDIDEQLGTSIGTDLEIDSIPVHLYCEVPNLDEYFTNPRFHGTIQAYVGKETDGTITPSAGSTIQKLLDDSDMPFEKAPVFKFNDKNTMISQVTGGLTADLSSLINESKAGEKICFDCNVEFNSGAAGSIVIEKDKIAGLGATSINLTAVIELPLAVRIKNQQKINILEKFGPESTDLFGRTEEPDENGIDEIISLVKYAEVSFWPEKKLFISDEPITLDIDVDGAGSEYSVQNINLNGGGFRLEDPGKALKIYPIQPSVDLTIPKGYLAIPRDIALIAPVRVTVQTDGEIQLLGQGADNE